jgi:hypothetical protein
MNEGVVRRATVWTFAVSGAGVVLWAAVAPAVIAPHIGPPRLSTPSHASARPYPDDSLARVAVSRDVFRSTRRSATVAYDPQRQAVPIETYRAPKPSLTLVGLLAGLEPTAVIQGIPSVEGDRVVRVGDVFAGLLVKQIVSDRVVIVGMDTTWVLRVREPWK